MADTAEAVKPEAGAQAADVKQTNCIACAKPIKKLKRYYRAGKYYCNKKCWRKNVRDKKKASEKKE